MIKNIGIMLITILLIITIGSRTKERYTDSLDIQDGSCECCNCGWQSCQTCAANIKACCGEDKIDGITILKMNFDRYSFHNKRADHGITMS